jgi:hypothetical protein
VYGLPLAAKAAMGTGGFALDVAKNLYGIGEETPAVAGYDPAAVLAATGATPMTDQQLADQAFEQYIQEAYGLAGPALEAMPKGGAGTAGAPAGANADIAAQTKAIQEATTAGGTEVSGLTPVSGTSARNLEAAAEQAKLQQQYLDFVKLQAAASGGKLGADWRKRYADQVQGEVARRRQQASEYRLQQALSQGDINRQIAAQRATQGITLPDPAVMQAKAEEYNNLDAQTKALYAINGITDVNSYVANYLKTIQPQG